MCRVAVEQAVHEELAMVLGVGLYECSEARCGHRNSTKTRTFTASLDCGKTCLPLFKPSGSALVSA
jgi:hypothetical protein